MACTFDLMYHICTFAYKENLPTLVHCICNFFDNLDTSVGPKVSIIYKIP